jgi:hypothetical protein
MNHEERIQKQVEAGNVPEGAEGETYRLVFSALKKEPHYKLSDDFAKRVAAMAPTPANSFDWDKFFLFVGLGVFGIALLYAVAVTHFTLSFGAFQFFKGYPFMFVLIALFIVAGQWLDTKLIKSINS